MLDSTAAIMTDLLDGVERQCRADVVCQINLQQQFSNNDDAGTSTAYGTAEDGCA